MRNFIFAFVIALLPLSAFAQAGSIVDYRSLDHGFAIVLPGGGTIADAYSDPEWVDDDSRTVVRWDSRGAGEPVVTMMVSALPLDHDATDDDIAEFVDVYTGTIAEGGEATVDETSDVLQIGNRGWISVLAHMSGSDGTVYYETFVTRQDAYIYAVLCFYQLNGEVETEYAKSLLETFTTD